MQVQVEPSRLFDRRGHRIAAGRGRSCGLPIGVACCFAAFIMAAPAFAFQDREFCVVAQQLAAAAEKDVGVWIDRTTRNAGMTVACDRKIVEFTRFTYGPRPPWTRPGETAK